MDTENEAVGAEIANTVEGATAGPAKTPAPPAGFKFIQAEATALRKGMTVILTWPIDKTSIAVYPTHYKVKMVRVDGKVILKS